MYVSVSNLGHGKHFLFENTDGSYNYSRTQQTHGLQRGSRKHFPQREQTPVENEYGC